MRKKLSLLAILLLLINVSLIAQIPTNGLVRYYPFTGTAMDFSGFDQDATVNGATLTPDRFLTTKSAYDLANSNTITLPNAVDLALSDYSYSIWVSLNDIPLDGNRFVFLSVGSSGGDQGITYNNNYNSNLNYYSGWGAFSYNGLSSVDTMYYSKPAVVNQWYHLVVTRSSTELKFYVNNLLIKSTNTANTAYYGNGSVESSLGMRWNGSLYANAKIDDVRIYNRAISTDEVNSLYNEGFCNELITVTDELVINLIKTGFNPVTYENRVTVFPNPTSEYITINFGNYDTMKGYSVKLIDMQGVTKYSKIINTQESTIDLTSLPLGAYLIKLVDSEGRDISTQKILLQ